MKPKQRVAITQRGERPDKLPIMVANSNTFICRYYGMTVEEFLTKADLCAEGNIRFTEEFEIDYNLCVNGYILYGCGPELGCEWKFAGKDFPGVLSGPLKTESDLDDIKVPEAPTGYFAHYLDVIDRVGEAIGRHYHISVSILGPHSVGCFLRGIEEALLDTVMNPVFLKRYMEVCTELSIYFGRRILACRNVHPILNEIFLTPDMMRPDTYHDLLAPYDLRVQEALGAQNAPNSLAAFMGKPGDTERQKGGRKLFNAFFNGTDSVEQLAGALSCSMPGLPFPAAVSGLALDSMPGEEIINYLRRTIDYLVWEKRRYPTILLSSVQADTVEKAQAIAEKIKMIQKFRDEYTL